MPDTADLLRPTEALRPPPPDRPLCVQLGLERPGEDRPRSIAVYAEAIQTRLAARGVRFLDTPYAETRMLPEADIVWAPGLGNRRVPRSLFAAGPRGIATIHGLNGLDAAPEFRTLGLRSGLGHYLWRRRIRGDWARLGPQVGAAILVSRVLAARASGLLRIPEGRMQVIPHGVSGDFFRPPGNPPGRYVLHVSQYSSVKNIPRILAAYDRVRDRIGLPLRIVSGGWPGDPATLPPGVEMTTALVPHAAVRDLMWGARVFLFPSIEDAFGLPVLEAMAAGVPVVTSAGTGAGEVAGDAGLCVDPADTDAIAAALLAAATDMALHDRLARAGRERAMTFSWDAAADRHLALMLRVAGRDGGRDDGRDGSRDDGGDCVRDREAAGAAG